MPLAPHPYGHASTTQLLPPRSELVKRLTVRLEYASFKLSHSRTLHSLSELEALYIRPFHTQALHRQSGKKERQERWRVQAQEADTARERRREQGECVDVMGPEAAKVDERSEGEFMGWSEKKLGKRKAVEGDEGPSLRHEQPKKATKRQRQASADKQRQRLAASSAKVDSRIRLPRPAASSSRVTPAPDYSEYSSHADGRPYTPYDIPTLHNTTSELLSPHSGLSSSHSDSIPSLQGSTSSTSTSRFLAMALQQPHPPDPVPHGASPFSARSTAASYGTTLAPASSSTSHYPAAAESSVSPLLEHAASPSSVLAPLPPGAGSSSHPSSSYPLPPHSLSHASTPLSQPQGFTSASALLSTPQPHPPAPSSASNRSPLMLGSQASFSALPPPPPLPFDGPPLSLSHASSWRGARVGGSSSPDQARRGLGEKGKERARWAEERDADGAERGQGTASAEKETSDDELPPADSADDSADLDLDPKFELELDMTQNRTQEDEGVQGEAAGFEELSQDTVLHDSQGGGESQDRDRGWEEEEEEEAAPKDGWDAQRYGAAAR